MAAHLPAAQAPTEFDSNLSTWLTNQHTESIFFIRFLPRPDKIPRITSLANRVRSMTTKGGERRDRINNGDCCTGFVVADYEHCFRLLTCAHGLGHLFKQSRPISVRTANELIARSVCCDHVEHQYRQEGLLGDRHYSKAIIAAIDCGNDLMLVDVPKYSLRDTNGAVCHSSHRPVHLSREVIGDKISKCLLLSWPSHKHRKRTKGQISTMRRMTEIGESNLNEYNMDLLEVNMGVELGSSGAPLFNGAGEVVGLLHGSLGEADAAHCSYFVALHHLNQFVAPHL